LKNKLSKQCYMSIAQCVAACCIHASPTQRDAMVSRFITDIRKGKDDASKLLALYCLGEIGRKADLSSHGDIQTVILSVFDSTSEETTLPNAASYALGNIAVGNLSKFLPFILKDIQEHPKREYLLLHSLKEIISRHSLSSTKVQDLTAHLPSILKLLDQHCQNKEEGTRNVVAECLGRLSLINPNELTPKLLDLSKSPIPSTKGTAITALKFTIVEHHHPIDQILLPSMPEFMNLLRDDDIGVRRAALLTFNYCAHNKPVLIHHLLSSLLPVVYGETKINLALIHEVEMGPFKHKVDDGLDLRKAAFECMYTLLETCFEKLEIPVFISHLVDGLKDQEMKMLSHLMLARLASAASAAVVEALDTLIEPLRVTVTNKCKESAVKQEVDRNEELVRGALRAVVAISRIANVEQNMKFEEFLKVIKGSRELCEKYEAIRKDTGEDTVVAL